LSGAPSKIMLASDGFNERLTEMVNKLIFMTTLAFAQILLTIEPRADTCDNYSKQSDIIVESFNRKCAGRDLTRSCLVDEAANILFYKNFLSACTGRMSDRDYQAIWENIRKNEKDLERYGDSGGAGLKQ
jgi:hypothetical protein